MMLRGDEDFKSIAPQHFAAAPLEQMLRTLIPVHNTEGTVGSHDGIMHLIQQGSLEAHLLLGTPLAGYVPEGQDRTGKAAIIIHNRGNTAFDRVMGAVPCHKSDMPA